MNRKKSFLAIAGLAISASLIAPNAMANDGGDVSTRSADCNAWSRGGTTGYSYCSGLGHLGAHRVKIICVDTRGVETTFYGPWVWNGKTSKRKCPGTQGGAVGILRVGSEIRD
ncbi:hypothetical protein [Streptomyces sp. Rer75]|uniref:hypothetical protein n=1 Tax=unclassified Streptomyces TaxID=2593676 RepID=UPI0015CFB0E5|nr:hypothetical protein [Streptomyces sp. Rer75]QLH23660.1 hypothetical protein HYQ63_26045 [Streptomyces sp. Rer75]